MISVSEIYKSFGTQQVLKNISLEVKKNETLTVVGPSGVGKSVLLKLILGVYSADHGQILIQGQDVTICNTEAEKNKIRENMGVLFQSAALLDSLSIFDNISFPLVSRNRSDEEIKEKTLKVSKHLSLEKHLRKFPQELPIGIRKRIGIARALVIEPEIFLFDEPNTGLDPVDGQEVYDLIKHCKQEWEFAGLVISHEIPEVFQVSDRVAMLLNGKIEAIGTPSNLQESDNPAVKQFLTGDLEGPIKIG